MEWFKNVVPMKEAHKLYNTKYLAMVDAYVMQVEEADVGKDWLDSYATTEILDAKYEKDDLDKVVKNQTDLNHEQQERLSELFESHKTLFGGTIRVYPHKKFHIEVEKGSKPKHFCPYAVPHVHLKAFKKI